MILDGRIFVACPPKYRITVNNKYVYFKNDKEFNEYKSEYVGSQYEVVNENISLLELIKNEDKFKRAFNNLKNKYSLPSEIISMILSNDDLLPVAEYLDEQGLYVSETENEGEFYAQGLLEYEWLDVYLTKEMQEEIKTLGEIYGSETIVINDKNSNELYECDIIDAIELVDTKFKFSRYRFKGLMKKLALILLT